MLVDVSHASKAAMLQAAELSTTPVVATHSCIHALCPVPRNLDDAQLDVLKATGGLVQITAVASFLRPQGKADTVAVADYMDHLDYAVRRCGVEHVGISSRFRRRRHPRRLAGRRRQRQPHRRTGPARLRPV